MVSNFIRHGLNAVVTGGARRLGAAVALGLAEKGVNVALHYNTSIDDVTQLAADITAKGVKCHPIKGDLSQELTAGALFDKAHDLFGPIDILINNASIFPEDTLADIDANSLHTNVDINALAPLVLGRCLASQKRPGVIINFLDTMIRDYDRKHASYHLSKRMLYSITRMQAIEYAPLLRVNGIAPGLVLPPEDKDESYLERLAHSNPLQSYGGPKGVVDAVLFLLDAVFITGQVIYIDGGRHLKGCMYD